MTCSGVTGKKLPVTSDCLRLFENDVTVPGEIVQTNSVYFIMLMLHSFVQTLNGSQVSIDIVCRTDEWFTNKLLPIACP